MEQELRTADFDYDLPRELIAQHPVEPRDHSRLMVVDRDSGQIRHSRFYDLPEYLREGDLLVANESRVIRARMFGRKVPTGGKVEVLLLRPAGDPTDVANATDWEALVSPGGRIREGTVLGFGEMERGPYLEGEIVARGELGARVIRFRQAPGPLLSGLGSLPLPPYVHETLDDPERYQTVYARTEGSAAAPTAGLHFTPQLIDRVRQAGARFATVTLHVGLDTFRPVHEEFVSTHRMHSEWYSLSGETADAIRAARHSGGRVIAVGTTSVRVLETIAQAHNTAGEGAVDVPGPAQGWTNIFITPGYKYGLVDSLITNFHLPRTTLLMLVAAFMGRELMLRAYNEAIGEEYRFYSFGDAMLIL